jgi:hypothetical protein
MKWSELSTEERDRLINTKVMGNPEFCDGNVVATPANYSSSPMSSSYVVWVCGKCNMMGTCNTMQDVPAQHVSKDIPSYSTDMNAAWRIVEHIAALPKTTDEPDHSRASRFMLWWENNSLWSHSAQQAIDAICLWALKDYGVEIEP